jgi:type II secretory pathway predicted ATPase ExeA
MYEPFFEFRKRPFPSVPHADAFFPGEAIEAARTTLVRCIRRAEGPGLVIGPSGTGKTMLCRVLAKELADQVRVVFLASGRLASRRALLQAMLYELGQPYRGLDEGEARLALADYITLSDECPNGILLLVDEAHSMPLRLLDEVRMTTNLAHEGKPWVRVVLVGGCTLEERFAGPKLDSFNQRIVARCYLESFGAAETQQYIWAQTAVAGGRGESLFCEAACQAAYRATDGVPRLINQVCDHALLLACAAGHRTISARHIEEAWADLQQLPTPWNGEATPTGDTGNVIEFGCLDDDIETPDDAAEESPDTIPALRISAEPDIEGQVDRIEQMLDGVDSENDEFRPAGSIGPEVELQFGEPSDPFNEQFAEEEVVDDWPGTFGRANFPESAVQPALPERQTPPEAALTPEPGAAMVDDEPRQEAPPADRGMDFHEPAEQTSDTEVLESQIRCSVDEIAADARPVLAAAADQQTAGGDRFEREERPELSVVAEAEEESCGSEPDLEPKRFATVCRETTVSRPKYSRLFATLRQG